MPGGFDNYCVVYYDGGSRYLRVGAGQTHDPARREEVTAQPSLPQGLEHGDFFRITGEEAERLQRC